MTCPNCGQENPDRARFCVRCGTAIAAAPDRRPEERRVVTALFCEILGLEELHGAALRDPEDTRSALRPFHLRIQRVVEGHGGTIDKFMGPVAFAVFGAPIAHEDDAERAVLAALRIREEVTDLVGDGAAAPPVRIGVNTGEVVVTFGPGPQVGEHVTGDAVNTASRLQTAAARGEILVGAPTFEATERLFRYEALPPVRVKGKAEPLPVWRPVEARRRTGAERVVRPAAPLVGRGEEMRLLEATFRRAVRGPSLQLVTVTGEPGVGKSRLIEEFGRRVDALPELIRWRQGRCLPYGEGVTFWALGEVVKNEAGILETDPPEDTRAKLAAAVELLAAAPSERDWLRERLAPLAGLEASQDVDRDEAFSAWRRFIEAMGEDDPLILVIEDLQWADPALVDFIDDLADRVVGLPVLVLCAARPELYERFPGWGGGKRNSTTIGLPPLSSSETAQLLSALLERAVLPAETQSALLERAGGNPLYAEEFVRMLSDRGILEDGGLRLDTSIPVPTSVQALIAARLDTLSPDHRALVQDAAVVGRVFWAGAAAAIRGLDEAWVREALHEISRRELLRPSRTSSIGGEAEYGFWHVLVRDVAYGQIPRSIRGAKHGAVAEWIERVIGNRSVDLIELLAFHYGEALELSRAAGVADLGDLQRAAIRSSASAGDRIRRLDARRALGYYRRALELVAEDEPEHPDLLIRAAEAGSMLGRFDEAEGEFRRAVIGFLARDDSRGLADALVRWARTKIEHGEPALAHDLLAEAVSLLEALPPGPELGRAYSRMAGDRWIAGEYAEAREWAEKALAIFGDARASDEGVLALGYRGAARCELGDAAGLEDLREALRLGLEAGLGEETAITYNNLAYELWFFEGPRASIEVWDEMQDFVRSRGFETLSMWADSGRILPLFDLGEWDGVLETADRMEAWDRERGQTQVGTVARTLRAWIMIRRGRLEEATRISEELLPLARRLGSAEFLAPALMIAAEVAAAAGRDADVMRHVREFVSMTEELPDVRTLFLPVAVRLLTRIGAVDEAAALHPGDQISSRQRLSVRTAGAVVDEARGAAEQALDAYVEAAEGWRRQGFPLEVGQCLVGAGRCLLDLGRRGEALDRLREGRDVLAGLGAAPLVSEADALLADATALSS